MRPKITFATILMIIVPCICVMRAAERSPVADAAERGDVAAVRALIQQAADVSAARADGMTALHFAAQRNDAELAALLLTAGANVRATTRLGGYTPLHLASQSGATAVIKALAGAGADINARTTTGATPLMFAAASGAADAVAMLVELSADPNATESVNGQTALMFAAALDRAEAARALVQHGADASIASTTVDLSRATPPEEVLQQQIRDQQNAKSAAAAATGGAAPPARSANTNAATAVAGISRPYTFNELIGQQGGLTALHFAARQGAMRTVQTLVELGADVNAVSPADRSSPLLVATINGQFDVAAFLLAHGAQPNLASDAGMTPLFAALNVEWAPKMFYPQPRAYLQQQTSYLDLMAALLDKGADPNARVKRKIWYTQYNFDLLRVEETGATAFWRAAYASDIAAMKLLVGRGADPNLPSTKPAQNDRFRQGGTRSGDDSKDHSGLQPVPTAGPDIPPLLAAAGAGYGEGFAANAHRFAPTGMLAAVKYLVDDLHADVNARDADGNTALHNAAARGDNEMIEYLVSKGADVTLVNRTGQTTVDMANGPVQRVQPYPETIKLLEKLGAKNNHKCVSC
ncbi:MAG TPA: ankyrin repeat domain-containing protein [Vicinamibacterales bacterium]|nr:ankyrin repeat domain-containing protein [Vicinamibacterales bacterium]